MPASLEVNGLTSPPRARRSRRRVRVGADRCRVLYRPFREHVARGGDALRNRARLAQELTPEDDELAERLCSGIDERSVIGPDGLSKYGCAPYPRPVIAFGSCTASTVTPRA